VAGSQIQANLGEGHVNVINAYEAILTESHLALVMEYAACGSLTSYVANRWQHAQHSGLFLSEDEARYFFRVGLLLLSPVRCEPKGIT
jgi:serine/threonine-protein kinase SRK2